ncbi:MAG: hypothetical protein J6U54_15355 [Clostridiales bacterium]|nr:hypothetical protein [Clostridiales bacterium]
MKQLKDKQVSDHLFYLVLAYLDETDRKTVYERHLEQYNEDGRPRFSLRDVEYSVFESLVDEAVVWFKSQTK